VVSMMRSTAAHGKTRPYTITASSNNSSSPSAGQTLTVVGLISQRQNNALFVSVSNTSPQICTNFDVYVWANITRSVDHAGFPLEYDPGVIELVNVTVFYMETSETRYELYHPEALSGSNFIKYTFHAIGPGTATINVLLQDFKGNAYQYNSNYDSVGIPPHRGKSSRYLRDQDG